MPRPGLAPGAGRRPARRRPRRSEGGLPRPGLGPRPRLRALWRHHRRDRRVRPAGPAAVGRAVPRPGDGGLRPHPDPHPRLGQQHALPRHRLRLRRQALRAALPRARDRRSGRGGRPLRAGQAAVQPCHPARRGRTAPRRRRGPPVGGDRSAGTGHDHRRERRRSPGGDEPVRAAPAAGPVPAADHVPGRDLAPRGIPRTPRRGLRHLRRMGRRPGDLRREAHGLARRGLPRSCR